MSPTRLRFLANRSRCSTQKFKIEYDAGGIPQYSRVISPAFILAAGIDLSVIRKITWKPQQILFTDSKTGKQNEFFLMGVDIVTQSDTAKFFINEPRLVRDS